MLRRLKRPPQKRVVEKREPPSDATAPDYVAAGLRRRKKVTCQKWEPPRVDGATAPFG